MRHVTSTKNALEQTVTNEYDLNGNLLKSTDENGNTNAMSYDGIGNMKAVTDPLGNITAMKYDALGNLSETIDALKGKTTYEYDSMGNSTKMTDALGNIYSYKYDEEGHNTSVTLPTGDKVKMSYDGNGQLIKCEDAQGLIINYEYDSMGRMVKSEDNGGNSMIYTYDTAGNILTQIDQTGRTASYEYDVYGRLIKLTEADGSVTAYEYDVMERITAVTDAEGHRITFAYDKVGNQLSMTKEDEAVYQYAYDKKNRVVSETNPLGAANVISVTDPKGNQTTYSVDLNDNVTKMTMPNGGEYAYKYDEAGRLQSMTSPLGYKKNFSYDAVDNIIKETDSLKSSVSYTYDKLHNLKSSTNPLDGTSQFEYDKYGNLVKETDPLGRTNTYSYDLAGRMVKAADPLGKITEFQYDPVGNLTAMTKPGKRTTSFGYDKNYNPVSITDPMAYVEKTVYDKSNRVTEEMDPLEQKTAYSYDKNGRVTSVTDKLGHATGFDYDPHGNVITMTDRTGLKFNLEYDANDNLTKVTDPMGGITSYGYDNMDNLVTFTNAANKKTDYSYDLERNLNSIKDPSGKTENFGYDDKGRLTSYTGASGKKTSYDYNKLNDLLEKSYEDAKGKETDKKVTYAYNQSGERVSMKDAIGKGIYEYDALGRISKVTDVSGKAVSYVYDEADNLQEIAYPDGTKVAYEYDLNDNLIKVTDREGAVTEFKHDALNRLTETIRPNEIKTLMTYDAMDHVTQLKTICTGCGETISTYAYTYNPQGYIIKEKATESLAGYVYDDKHDGKHEDGKHDSEYPHGNKHNGKHDKDGENAIRVVTSERSYEYDDNWQLTKCTEKEENKGTTVYEYKYDKVGNRISYEKVSRGETKEKYSYEYNASNQLITKTDKTEWKPWKQEKTTYEYDADGNLISEKGKDKKQALTYEYNAENRLTVVKQGGAVLMAALYDGDLNRVFQIDSTGAKKGSNKKDSTKKEVVIPEFQRTEEGNSAKEQLASILPKGVDTKGYTLTQYVNDVNRENAEVLMEYGADDTVRQAYTYGETRLSMNQPDGTSYYLNDGRGSVAGLITEAGQLTNSYQYDPYGNLTSGMPDAVNYYGYNAESTNINTGFQYLRARYYNTVTGTFISEDSNLGSNENPLTKNRYSYVINNPINFIDPTGNSFKSFVKKGMGIAKNFIKSAGSALKKVGNLINSGISAIGRGIKGVLTSARTITQKIWDNTSKLVGKMFTGFANTFRSFKNGFTSFKTFVAQRASHYRKLIQRELCITSDRIKKILSNAKENMLPKVFRTTSDMYDSLPEDAKLRLGSLASLYEKFGSKTVGMLLRALTTNNKLEKELYDFAYDPISKFFSFEYNAKGDYYYTNNGKTIQSLGGFMDFYDTMGYFLGMDLDTKTVTFTSNGTNYRLQLWKGTYGFQNAYGGEVGLYSNKDGNGWYACVSGNDRIQSSQKIINNKTNDVLLENDTRSYTEDGHYWNLAIRTDPGYKKSDLTQVSRVAVADENVRQDMLNALRKKPGITADFDHKTNEIVITYY